MKATMKKIKKFRRVMSKRWREAGIMIAILIFAAVITVIRPFDGGTVGYFSDVTTPLILVVGILLIIFGIKQRTI